MPARAADDGDVKQYLREAALAFQKGDCKMADWDRVTRHPKFETLPSRMRSTAYFLPVLCGVAGDRASELIRAATAEEAAPAGAWGARFVDSARSEDNDDALGALEKAAEKSGDGTADLYDDDLVFRFWRKLGDDKPARMRMAAALDGMKWRPKALTSTPDGIWLAHAANLLEAGNSTEAERFLRKLSRPEPLIEMRTDKRFAAIVDAHPNDFDVKFAAIAILETDRSALKAVPRDAESIQAVAYDLRVLGRFDEALTHLDAALTQRDLKNLRGLDWQNWIQNERAYVLVELGRYDEGIAAMRKASRQSERGGANVSQMINLALMLNDLGRYSEALKALAPLEGKKLASPYGQMWIATNRACAYAGLQKIELAKAEMAFADAHVADNRLAHLRAALCLDDDSAARSLVLLLRSKDPSSAIVSFSKSGIEPPLPPHAKQMEERLERVQQRPDVRAAFDSVGRAERFEVHLGAMSF